MRNVKKITVMQIIPNLEKGGGAEKMVIDLSVFLDKTKFNIIMCSLYKIFNETAEILLKKNNIKIHYLSKRLGFDAKIMFPLTAIIKQENPDVIHTHLYSLKYTLPSMLTAKPCLRVHTIHNKPEEEVNRFQRNIHKFAFRNCGVIPIILANQFKDYMETHYEINKYKVIYNGIDVNMWGMDAQKVGSIREGMGLIDKKVILCAACFKQQKNHHFLIRAFSKIKKENKTAILLLAGDGVLLSEMKSLTKKLRLEDSVKFLGLRDDMRELMAISDLVVLTSTYEGMPISILEAMASGLPVVASAVGAVPEIVKDGVTGFLFPSGDVSKMVKNVTTLLSNDKLRKDMGENARIESKKYDARIMARNYEDLYRSGLAKMYEKKH